MVSLDQTVDVGRMGADRGGGDGYESIKRVAVNSDQTDTATQKAVHQKAHYSNYKGMR